MKLKASELRLADVVKFPFAAYNTATVKQIDQGVITFFRPYTATANFSYTGGVICYVGIEEFTRRLDSAEVFEVIERKDLQ